VSLRKYELIHWPHQADTDYRQQLTADLRDARVQHLVKMAENIDVGQRNSTEFDRLEGRAPIAFDDSDVERVIMDYVMATHTEADAGDEQRGLSATEQRKRLTLGAAWQWQLFAIKRPGDVRWNFLNSNFVRVPPMQDRKDLAFHTDVEVACNVADKGKGLRANAQVHSHVPRTNSIAINPFTGLGRHILSNIQTGAMNFPFLLDAGHTHTHNLFLYNSNPPGLSSIPMAANVFTKFCKNIFEWLGKVAPKMPAHYMRHIALRLALACKFTTAQRVHAGWPSGASKGGQQESSYNFANPDMDAMTKSHIFPHTHLHTVDCCLLPAVCCRLSTVYYFLIEYDN
jgi:hypothetical protein